MCRHSCIRSGILHRSRSCFNGSRSHYLSSSSRFELSSHCCQQRPEFCSLSRHYLRRCYCYGHPSFLRRRYCNIDCPVHWICSQGSHLCRWGFGRSPRCDCSSLSTRRHQDRGCVRGLSLKQRFIIGELQSLLGNRAGKRKGILASHALGCSLIFLR